MNQAALLEAVEEAIRTATPEEHLGLALGLTAKLGTLAVAMSIARTPAASEHEDVDENLSVAETARRLGVSRDYLYRHSSSLPFTMRIGRRLLFSAKGLERWRRQRTGKHRS